MRINREYAILGIGRRFSIRREADAVTVMVQIEIVITPTSGIAQAATRYVRDIVVAAGTPAM
jgi:hypothetical protein